MLNTNRSNKQFSYESDYSDGRSDSEFLVYPFIGKQFLVTAKAMKKHRSGLLQQATELELLFELTNSSISKNLSQPDRDAAERKAFSKSL